MADLILSPRLRFEENPTMHPRRRIADQGRQAASRAAVLDRLETGFYKLIDRPCPLCGGLGLDIIADVERHGLRLPTSICRTCSLVHSNPVLRNEDFRHFYKHYFRPLYNSRVGMPSLEMLERKKKSNLEQIGRIATKAPALSDRRDLGNARLLDVGCGAGNFTWAWSEWGFRAAGIDLNEEYLKLGREQGLDLRATSLTELDPNEQFDVVSYHHVLEHIPGPRQELSLVHQMLKPGGLLVVVVPGLRNVERKYLGDLRDYLHIAHTTAFTRQTLELTGRSSGFEPLYVDDHIYGVFRKGAIPQAVAPARDAYEETLAFLREVEGRYGTEEGIHRMLKRHEAVVRARYKERKGKSASEASEAPGLRLVGRLRRKARRFLRQARSPSS